VVVFSLGREEQLQTARESWRQRGSGKTMSRR
jgi:hypothetical protein